MALQPNLKNGKAVADIQAVYFLKHDAGVEPAMMTMIDSPDWFPVLTLRGTVTVGQDATSIEKILVDQFDAPIGITTEPGDFNFEALLPSMAKGKILEWLEDDAEVQLDDNGNPITIDGREIIGMDLYGKIYEVSVLIKTRTGATIIFSNAQVTLSFTKEDKVFVFRLNGQVLAPANEDNYMVYIASEAPATGSGSTGGGTTGGSGTGSGTGE